MFQLRAVIHVLCVNVLSAKVVGKRVTTIKTYISQRERHIDSIREHIRNDNTAYELCLDGQRPNVAADLLYVFVKFSHYSRSA